MGPDMLVVEVEKKLGEFSLMALFTSESGATALFGPSGAGKTSIINMIAGLLRPDRGRIVLDGDVLFDDAAHINVPVVRRRIGYVFQEGRLFPHLSVKHNLDYGRWMGGHTADAAAFAHAVELLDIGHLLDRRPGKLSGGGRPRAADASASAVAGRATRLARRSAQAGHPALPGTAARRGEGADDLCQSRCRRGQADRQPRGAAGRRTGCRHWRRGVVEHITPFVPAKAGTQNWIPACAGMSENNERLAL